MELWVRSQSKETLLKVSKVCVCDEDILATTESEFDERIGTYKSKERALEVLDEIQNLMLCNKDAKYSGDASINELANCYLYEMPEE